MINNVEICICIVTSWMKAKKISLNPSNTEALLLSSSRSSVSESLPSCIVVDGSTVNFSESVKSLDVTLDSNISLKTHVLNIYRLSYFELRRISSV